MSKNCRSGSYSLFSVSGETRPDGPQRTSFPSLRLSGTSSVQRGDAPGHRAHDLDGLEDGVFTAVNQPAAFEVIEASSNRGKDKLVDRRGFCYTVKVKTGPTEGRRHCPPPSVKAPFVLACPEKIWRRHLLVVLCEEEEPPLPRHGDPARTGLRPWQQDPHPPSRTGQRLLHQAEGQGIQGTGWFFGVGGAALRPVCSACR